MHFSICLALTWTTAIALVGCSSLPRERGYVQTGQLIEARRGVAPSWSPDTAASISPDVPTKPLSAEQAIRLSFLYNPRICEQYARLGLGRAELDEARRISNPAFGYARFDPHSGNGSQITRSVSMSFTDLLLLPARKRFAAAELDRLQKTVAAQLLDLAAEVETAWFESVSADQVAAMRDVVARATEASADLAQRFFDAGNISRLQLEQELAAATQARIAAVRAAADGRRARSTLAGLIGLPAEGTWTTLAQLPAPPDAEYSVDTLLPLALEQRLDLAAVRQEVALREDALGVSRHWRWLGSVEVGYERERELDGGVLRGPSLSLELPIFNQGQGAIARAQAELMDARARLDGLALAVHNDARLGVERMSTARDIAERYRTVLLPKREAIVARTQEQVNFMLVGVFELILAKQQEYDAYQEYLESVRDYWTARAELRRVVGGRLPNDDAALEPAVGVDAILPAKSVDPHAGHAMTMPTGDPAPEADPHAGHAMPQNATGANPHAGHDITMPAAEDPSPEESEKDTTHDHGDSP